MCEFDKLDKTFASDLYLIYKRSPSAWVCISDKDQLLMFYLYITYKEPVQNIPQINNIDNEAHKKIHNDFYWTDRYVNCILKPRIYCLIYS